MTVWVAVLALAAGTYALRLAGPLLAHRLTVPQRTQRPGGLGGPAAGATWAVAVADDRAALGVLRRLGFDLVGNDHGDDVAAVLMLDAETVRPG